ncbi:MAG: hypothetical protein KFF73_04220, partial [Cyclobacteriaceae bacterium]|nr:hypothetical protein [Cyclobacteriaceae bacterium]
MAEDNIYYFGEIKEPAQVIELQAGPVRMIYENGSLRYLKAGDHEILRMIYFAVRDHNWETIEGELLDENVEAGEQEFSISYTSVHKKGPVNISFSCSIKGEKTGHIEFIIHGQAESSFKKNRIGFCDLHPVS